MRKIEVKKWKAISNGVELEENTTNLLISIISGQKPEEIPLGIYKFRLFGRLAKAFEKGEKTGMLELEEADYEFIKKALEKDVASVWAFNTEISAAINAFLDAKQEE